MSFFRIPDAIIRMKVNYTAMAIAMEKLQQKADILGNRISSINPIRIINNSQVSSLDKLIARLKEVNRAQERSLKTSVKAYNNRKTHKNINHAKGELFNRKKITEGKFVESYSKSRKSIEKINKIQSGINAKKDPLVKDAVRKNPVIRGLFNDHKVASAKKQAILDFIDLSRVFGKNKKVAIKFREQMKLEYGKIEQAARQEYAASDKGNRLASLAERNDSHARAEFDARRKLKKKFYNNDSELNYYKKEISRVKQAHTNELLSKDKVYTDAVKKLASLTKHARQLEANNENVPQIIQDAIEKNKAIISVRKQIANSIQGEDEKHLASLERDAYKRSRRRLKSDPEYIANSKRIQTHQSLASKARSMYEEGVKSHVSNKVNSSPLMISLNEQLRKKRQELLDAQKKSGELKSAMGKENYRPIKNLRDLGALKKIIDSLEKDIEKIHEEALKVRSTIKRWDVGASKEVAEERKKKKKLRRDAAKHRLLERNIVSGKVAIAEPTAYDERIAKAIDGINRFERQFNITMRRIRRVDNSIAKTGLAAQIQGVFNKASNNIKNAVMKTGYVKDFRVAKRSFNRAKEKFGKKVGGLYSKLAKGTFVGRNLVDPVVTSFKDVGELVAKGIKAKASKVKSSVSKAGKSFSNSGFVTGAKSAVSAVPKAFKDVFGNTKASRAASRISSAVGGGISSLGRRGIGVGAKISRGAFSAARAIAPRAIMAVDRAKAVGSAIVSRVKVVGAKAATSVLSGLNSISKEVIGSFQGILNIATGLSGFLLGTFVKSLVGVAAGFSMATYAAGKYEAAFTDIIRIAGIKDPFKKSQLDKNIKKIAVASAGVDFTELLALADFGARLGIQGVPQLSNFAEELSRVKLALTDIGVEEMATKAMRILKVFGMGENQIGSFGAVLVGLDNASTASGKDILELTRRMSGAASKLGISVQETMALSAAMRDVGIAPEVGGTAIQNLVVRMGAYPKLFRNFMNKTEKEFNSDYDTRPMELIKEFLKDLSSLNTRSQAEAFMKLGLTGQRITSTIWQLVEGIKEMDKYTAIATNEWATQESVVNAIALKGNTFFAILQKTWNQVNALGIAIGSQVLDGMKELTLVAYDFLAILTKSVEGNSFLKQINDAMIYFSKAVRVMMQDTSLAQEVIAVIMKKIANDIIDIIGGAVKSIVPLLTKVGESLQRGFVGFFNWFSSKGIPILVELFNYAMTQMTSNTLSPAQWIQVQMMEALDHIPGLGAAEGNYAGVGHAIDLSDMARDEFLHQNKIAASNHDKDKLSKMLATAFEGYDAQAVVDNITDFIAKNKFSDAEYKAVMAKLNRKVDDFDDPTKKTGKVIQNTGKNVLIEKIGDRLSKFADSKPAEKDPRKKRSTVSYIEEELRLASKQLGLTNDPEKQKSLRSHIEYLNKKRDEILDSEHNPAELMAKKDRENSYGIGNSEKLIAETNKKISDINKNPLLSQQKKNYMISEERKSALLKMSRQIAFKDSNKTNEKVFNEEGKELNNRQILENFGKRIGAKKQSVDKISIKKNEIGTTELLAQQKQTAFGSISLTGASVAFLSAQNLTKSNKNEKTVGMVNKGFSDFFKNPVKSMASLGGTILKGLNEADYAKIEENNRAKAKREEELKKKKELKMLDEQAELAKKKKINKLMNEANKDVGKNLSALEFIGKVQQDVLNQTNPVLLEAIETNKYLDTIASNTKQTADAMTAATGMMLTNPAVAQ